MASDRMSSTIAYPARVDPHGVPTGPRQGQTDISWLLLVGSLAIVLAWVGLVGGVTTADAQTPSATVRIPARIDRTGKTDVGPALRSFIAGVPDGTTIIFPKGTYKCASRCIQLSGRRDLVFLGHGATIRNVGSGRTPSSSAFHLVRDNRRVKIIGFTLKGGNSDAATEDAYHPGVEHSEGVAMYDGNKRIVMANLRILDQWGHCLYIASSPGAPTNERITFRDSTCERTGVMGLVVASGRRVKFLRNVIRDIALYPIDFEDGHAGQPVDRVTIQKNVIKRWGWNADYTCHAIVGASSEGLKPFRKVRILGNKLSGGDAARPSNGCPRTAGVISFHGTDRKSGFEIRNNRVVLPANQRRRPGVRLRHLDGGSIVGNHMPYLGISCAMCSGVTVK